MGIFEIILIVLLVLVGLRFLPIFTIGCLFIGLGFEVGHVIWSRIGLFIIFLDVIIGVWVLIGKSGSSSHTVKRQMNAQKESEFQRRMKEKIKEMEGKQ